VLCLLCVVFVVCCVCMFVLCVSCVCALVMRRAMEGVSGDQSTGGGTAYVCCLTGAGGELAVVGSAMHCATLTAGYCTGRPISL